MADQSQLDILVQGVESWNEWREQNPSTVPDLRVDFSGLWGNLMDPLYSVDLTGANFTGANLAGASFAGRDVSGASLSGANLSGANLSEANLSGANLTEANLTGANLTGVDPRRSGPFERESSLGRDLTGATGLTQERENLPTGTR